MGNDSQFQPTFDGLLELAGQLRGPDGCPWDREQTRSSMKRYVLEECYELLEALDSEDADGMIEELGDVLFQYAFLIQLGKEDGTVNQERVFSTVIDKLTRRHPHVFGDAEVSNSKEVESNWNDLKLQERSGSQNSILDGIPKSMPALSYSHTIQERVSRSGFEWDDINGVLSDVREELDELEEAESRGRMVDELGDVLFALVNLSRWLEADAEDVLRRANDRFRTRFATMERLSVERGTEFRELPMEEKDALWEEAKRLLSDVEASETGID